MWGLGVDDNWKSELPSAPPINDDTSRKNYIIKYMAWLLPIQIRLTVTNSDRMAVTNLAKSGFYQFRFKAWLFTIQLSLPVSNSDKLGCCQSS